MDEARAADRAQAAAAAGVLDADADFAHEVCPPRACFFFCLFLSHVDFTPFAVQRRHHCTTVRLLVLAHTALFLWPFFGGVAS